ncbi:MAG: hypothetical protein HY075_03740 [Deltaproteobacteria bacterium]|nr:hypothetical protein [Deltaproteobacteria bacterium]
MAYLNWKTRPGIKLTRSQHPTRQSQLEVALPPELVAELHAELAAAFAPGGSELKLELPEGWVTYWKLKGGLSRLQLAHPAADQWVATIQLTDAHGAALLAGLQALGAPGGAGFAVGTLGAMAPIVNFELVLARA